MRRFSTIFITIVVLTVGVITANFFFGQKGKEEIKIEPPKIEISQTPVTADTQTPLRSAMQSFAGQVPDEKILSPMSHDYQKWNNCGPVTAVMILSYFAVSQTQQEAASWLKPNGDDKHVSGEEMVWYLENFGLAGQIRVGGNIQLIETLLANDIPVIIYDLLNEKEDIGHYRAMRGYNRKKQILISNDSYYGPARELSYSAFLKLWKPFNYKFIPVYRPEDGEKVRRILGETYTNDYKMYENSQKLADRDLVANSNDVFALLNRAESLLGMQKFQEAKESFEKAESLGLPRRALWYLTWPVKIYRELGEYDKVFALAEKVFTSGAVPSSEYYYERGLVYLAQNQKEKAKIEFNLALQYQPNFKFAKEALEKIS